MQRIQSPSETRTLPCAPAHRYAFLIPTNPCPKPRPQVWEVAFTVVVGDCLLRFLVVLAKVGRCWGDGRIWGLLALHRPTRSEQRGVAGAHPSRLCPSLNEGRGAALHAGRQSRALPPPRPRADGGGACVRGVPPAAAHAALVLVPGVGARGRAAPHRPVGCAGAVVGWRAPKQVCCSRLLLPASRNRANSAARSPTPPAGAYLLIKAQQTVERAALAALAVRQVTTQTYGSAPSAEEVQEGGNQCPICQVRGVWAARKVLPEPMLQWYPCMPLPRFVPQCCSPPTTPAAGRVPRPRQAALRPPVLLRLPGRVAGAGAHLPHVPRRRGPRRLQQALPSVCRRPHARLPRHLLTGPPVPCGPCTPRRLCMPLPDLLLCPATCCMNDSNSFVLQSDKQANGRSTAALMHALPRQRRCFLRLRAAACCTCSRRASDASAAGLRLWALGAACCWPPPGQWLLLLLLLGCCRWGRCCAGAAAAGGGGGGGCSWAKYSCKGTAKKGAKAPCSGMASATRMRGAKAPCSAAMGSCSGGSGMGTPNSGANAPCSGTASATLSSRANAGEGLKALLSCWLGCRAKRGGEPARRWRPPPRPSLLPDCSALLLLLLRAGPGPAV